ncbi:MAG: cytochrome c oxidase subunit 3 family protein [Pirellulaceae bacterium]
MSHVAHHFDDAQQQLDAATIGMWLFLATEVLFFGGMFLAYTVYRTQYPAAFEEGSAHLSVPIGTTNTAILLTSSLSMALAIHAARRNRRWLSVALLGATMLLGAAFLGVKAFEYADKFEHHLVPGRHFALEHPHNPDVSPGHVELFYGLYFAMTGMHALHMVIGLGVLAVLAVMTGRGAFSAEYHTPLEMTGLYWHFVDMVWVFLFPLLYLIG